MTRSELEQTYYLSRELKMWERELKRIRALPPRADNAAEEPDKPDLETLVIAKKEEIRDSRDRAVRYIINIPDSLNRMVVYYRCVSLMSWRRIACEVGGNITESGVRMIYTRFFKKGKKGAKK